MTYSLRDFGSYCAGGRVHTVSEGTPQSIKFTRDAEYIYDPKGSYPIEHAYVQYFVPSNRNEAASVVLLHGGGMCGTTFDTTPDGRPGWLHRLLDSGYEVHVIDNVERGRAGFAPGVWQGEPLLRSMEEAWHLFRFGKQDDYPSRQAFENQKFPVAHIEDLARRFSPRWLTTTQLHIAALISVLEKTGPSTVICHSQGGEIAFDAAFARPELFTHLVAIEPSSVPQSLEPFKILPLTMFYGDFLGLDPRWAARAQQWEQTVGSIRKLGGPVRKVNSAEEIAPGASHLPMMDSNSDDHLALLIEIFSAAQRSEYQTGTHTRG